MEETNKTAKAKFPPVYWLVIIFEFFERGAYYGMMSILAVYLTDKLNFTVSEAGSVLGIIQPTLYFLPILTGAIADKVGYRRMLTIAFALLGSGYFLASQATEYFTVFLSLAIMALGAGTFKPVISGTIARVTSEKNSSVGFGIFYWSINLGAFLFPLFIVPALKAIDWSYVFIASSICTGLMILPVVFLYKEPVKAAAGEAKESIPKAVASIAKKIIVVFSDWRFILFILIYSLFWVLYFQMYGTVLWYVQAFVDATPLNNFISSLFGINWYFDIEHVTVINALTIILLQLAVSRIVKNTAPIPTIIVGLSMATLGMAFLAISSNIWIFILGLFTFSIGEMTAHPKYISYLGLIAPHDKKATYLGFGFLYGAFGSFIGSFLGSNLYDRLVNIPIIEHIRLQLAKSGIALAERTSLAEALKTANTIGISNYDVMIYGNPTKLWLIFTLIGIVAVLLLIFYIKKIAKPETGNEL